MARRFALKTVGECQVSCKCFFYLVRDSARNMGLKIMDLGLAFVGFLFLNGLFLCMAAEHEINFDVSFNEIFTPRTKQNGFGPIFLCI